MISGRQHAKHTRIWADVCAEMNWKVDDDAQRLSFYAANKLPASRKDWHPVHDFDRFIDACNAILGQRTPDRVRATLVYNIEQTARKAGFAEAYLKKMAFDQHGLGLWRELHHTALQSLFYTVKARARAKRNAAHKAAKKTGTVVKRPSNRKVVNAPF